MLPQLHLQTEVHTNYEKQPNQKPTSGRRMKAGIYELRLYPVPLEAEQ